jgi:hypothetical protein
MTLCGGYIQMTFFFLGFPNESSKIKTFVVLRLFDAHIFFKISLFGAFEENISWPSKRSFQQCIARPNQKSFDPYFKGICGQESNSQFYYWPFI